jgi:nucleotide-binding universal stress UspA family protein
MTVLCGTDFSAPAADAATVAALLATKLRERLTLMHVVEVAAGELVEGGPLHGIYAPLPELLKREADRLHRELGAEVSERIVVGVPDEVLVQVAETEHARLIVLASLGRRASVRWLLGSVAERTAQTAPVPVLVVRGVAGFQAWLRGERPLKVMIGVDLSETAKSALEWTAALRRLGACNVTVAHIVWPLEQARAGIPGPVRLDGLHPELEQALLRDVTAFVGESLGGVPARVLVRPGLGRLDVHLTELAEAEQVDLLVVGSHQRVGVSRLWHGSVSRGALLNASMSVACVPVPIRVQQAEQARDTV